MKRIFDCADSYVQSRNWKMLALVKFCLCSIGMLMGLAIPAKHRKTSMIAAFGVFLATYIPLMADFICFAADFFRPRAAK